VQPDVRSLVWNRYYDTEGLAKNPRRDDEESDNKIVRSPKPCIEIETASKARSADSPPLPEPADPCLLECRILLVARRAATISFGCKV